MDGFLARIHRLIWRRSRQGSNDLALAERARESEIQATWTQEPGHRILGRYEVHRVLARGAEPDPGTAEVAISVYDHETGLPFVLKTLHDALLASGNRKAAFRKTASAWVGLGPHPFIVQAHGIVEFEGKPYIVLDAIAPDERGRTCLADHLLGKPLPLTQALRWAIQVCHAMECARSGGIPVHGDLKPHNIMIATDQRVRVSDFGLAGVRDPGAVLRHGSPGVGARCTDRLGTLQVEDRALFGTAGYIAPEILEGRQASVVSDIWSFGIVLHQMAKGSPRPFDADCDHDRAAGPTPIETPMWPIIAHCTAADSEHRFEGFAGLFRQLEDLLERETGETFTLPTDLDLQTWTWTTRGDALQALRRHERAVACYDRVLALNPWFTEALSKKGVALLSCGKLKDADACFDRALGINPRSSANLCNKGIALQALGQFDEAISYYAKALEVDPDSVQTLNNRGNSHQALGQLQEAIACYGRALEIDPAYAEAWYNRGRALHLIRHLDEAIECYDRALAIRPDLSEAWYNKALAYEAAGNVSEAADALRRFCSLVGREDPARTEVARARLRALEERLIPGTSS